MRLPLLAGALCLALLSPVYGQVPPPDDCYTIEELAADTETAGGILAGAAYYDGVATDATVIVQGVVEILAFGFKDGCMIGMQGIDFVKPSLKGNPA